MKTEIYTIGKNVWLKLVLEKIKKQRCSNHPVVKEKEQKHNALHRTGNLSGGTPKFMTPK